MCIHAVILMVCLSMIAVLVAMADGPTWRYFGVTAVAAVCAVMPSSHMVGLGRRARRLRGAGGGDAF